MSCPHTGSRSIVNGSKSMRTRTEKKWDALDQCWYDINVHDGYDVTKIEVCNDCNNPVNSWVEKES